MTLVEDNLFAADPSREGPLSPLGGRVWVAWWVKATLPKFTPWKFNIAPENGWLEDEFPFGKAYFQGLC